MKTVINKKFYIFILLNPARITKVQRKLTVRFLVPGSGTWTTEFLWLAPSGISDQQSTVVLDQDVFHFLFAGFVDVCKQKQTNYKSTMAHSNNLKDFKTILVAF